MTDGRTPGTSGYADSCALHVLSRSTLDGWDEPHTEDRAHGLRTGSTELGYAKLAIRCAVTMVEQESGRRAGPEPLRTLAGYRRTTTGGVAFGTKFAVLRPGRVSVGDDVTVTAWGDSELRTAAEASP